MYEYLEDYKEAYYLSNIFDYEDWQTCYEYYQFTDSFWGPLTTDGFANVYSTKLPRFISLFWLAESEGVDAFFQN